MNCLRPITRNVLHRSSPRYMRAFATATDAAGQQQQQQFDNRVKIVEVGPRDGLQNEKHTIPLTIKIELIERLARTGLTTIEAGSFVSPKWVPQMESSNEILEHILQGKIESPNPICYSFLAPNLKGLANASATLNAHPGAYVTESTRTVLNGEKPEIELAVFAAATETFTQKNLNCDIATSLSRFRDVIAEAKKAIPDVRVRAYISVVLGCPFEGPDVDPHRVAEMATDLLGMGADEIALGDTTGMGTAPRTGMLLRCLGAAGVRNEDVALHFHDTFGQALVNIAVGLEHGIRRFDAAVGGLGGCPYSPGATGNVATEDVVYFMESLGMDTGVDLDGVVDVGEWIVGVLGKGNDSSVGRAVLGARARKGSG
ncbi:3-hydroxy-3-isohexenylglutaryl-CoA/hydroxy-methylglutaryl-CoA lyase [Cytospora mali]|uniref:hydroxymethylglutaryl-CoA lyase n=1 Tax=Cytospora mali TaxID=578113 RepID=A0A194VDY5_CYTMA|nr:3-hydroxy-3-isohexenylglutaryl-CoA/hydroxy-methylglutaryl-CoA lyase [Valsa mali var. pyri (nom. inval.)]